MPLRFRSQFLWLGFLLFLLNLVALPAWSQSAGVEQSQLVKARLTSPQKKLVPGEECRLTVELEMAPGVHIYGREPGDAGLPTEIEWQLPQDWPTPEENWPQPTLSSEDGLKCFIYNDKLDIEAKMRVPLLATPGQNVTLKAMVIWLACSETCVPGQANVSLTMPVAGVATPAAGNSSSSPAVQGILPGGCVVNELPGAPSATPLTSDSVSSSPDVATSSSDSIAPFQDFASTSPDSVPSSSDSIPEPPVSAPAPLGEAMAVLLAFAGGIILNLMPCVFPVLSLKALALVNSGQAEQRQRKLQALAYSLGVVVSFWLIAGLLLILRQAGQELGWGFQMQSPYFVICMAVLFMGLGYSMLGFWEIGVSLTRLGDVSAHSGSSFLSGVLATVVATPCTAPFMGTALGYALTLPWYSTMLIFTSLGLGMALPVAVLSLWPAWQRLLPQPGAWMETLKQALAFPLLLAAVYFAWVVDVQAGPYVMAALLTAWVALGLALWINGRWGGLNGKLWAKILSVCVALLGLAAPLSVYYSQVQRTIDHGTSDQERSSVPGSINVVGEGEPSAWSPQAVEAVLQSGHPVFVDFGAAWCLTCQFNERAVLQNAKVQQAMRERGVVLLKADWTDRNDSITRELARFGRSGVPLYVYYPDKYSEPRVLSELITVDSVLDIL